MLSLTFSQSFFELNVSVHLKVLRFSSIFVVSKLSQKCGTFSQKCGEEAKMRHFPHDCGTVDTYVIGVNRPAFGGTVPHFHQMSRVPRNETDVPHFVQFFRCQLFYIFALERHKMTNFKSSSVHTSHAARRLYFTRGNHHQ